MNDPADITKTTVSSAREPKTLSLSFNSRSILKVIIVIVLIGLAFWLGYLVGHDTKATAATAATGGSTPFGNYEGQGGFRGNGGGLGTVTAISSTSITVQNSRTGDSKTYAITSSTTISDDGQAATYNDIAAGDTVIVIPSTSNASSASSILVNPSFGGQGGGSGSSTGSSASD